MYANEVLLARCDSQNRTWSGPSTPTGTEEGSTIWAASVASPDQTSGWPERKLACTSQVWYEWGRYLCVPACEGYRLEAGISDVPTDGDAVVEGSVGVELKKQVKILIVLTSIHAVLVMAASARIVSMSSQGATRSLAGMFGFLLFAVGVAVAYAAYALKTDSPGVACALLAGCALLLFVVSGPIAGLITGALAIGARYVAIQA